MTNKVLVSICMITYKHEAYVAKAIESVLMQITNYDYEVIIADDNSPDRTPEIINEIIKTHSKGTFIRYYRHPENLGMMNNFSFALKMCKGKYIAICEGDDYWSSVHKLQKQVDFLEQNQNYVLLGHNANFNKNGKEMDELVRKVTQKYIDFKTSDLIQRNPFVTCTTIFKNINLEHIDVILNNFSVGDKALFTFLSFQGKCRFYSEPLGFYRKHDNSVTSKNRKEYKSYKNELINRIKHAKFWNDYSGKKYNNEFNSVTQYRSKILSTMALRNMDFSTAIYYSQYVNLKDINKISSRIILRFLRLINRLTRIFF